MRAPRTDRRPSLPYPKLTILALTSALVITGRAAAQGDLPEQANPGVLSIAGQEHSRIEGRANQFTSSSQERVALDWDQAGVLTLVWQSRRQEAGSYGIFARRFSADGRALGRELHVNSTTSSMQTMPALAVDRAGASWFAWRSFGQDGDAGTIVARRFDARSRNATPELIVNESPAGDQTEVVLAALPDGRALAVWVSPTDPDPDSEGQATGIFARFLGADGEVDGPSMRVDQGRAVNDALPSVSADAEGSLVVVWARRDRLGIPLGIFGRNYDVKGEARGAEFRVDEGRGVEPSVASAPGGVFAVAWLHAEQNDYGIRTRRFTLDEHGLHPRAIRTVDVDADGEGYTSGVAIAMDASGRSLVSWNRFGDGPQRAAGLFARCHDERGAALGDCFRVTAQSDGNQRIAAASGTTRALLDRDGRMAFGWTGDGGLGDSSGAHLTLLMPTGLEIAATDVELPDSQALSDEAIEAPAAPHDPPTFDPRRRQSRPDEPPGEMPGAGQDLDFLGIVDTGWTPPDPHMAVGPEHVVLVTNGAIAWFLKDGTFQFQDELEGSNGFWGNEGATSFVFDPEVIYDPHTDRFMAMANERASNSFYLLAVSDDSDPNGSWHKYRIDATAITGMVNIDSPNINVDDEVIYLTADFFGPTRFNVLTIEKAQALSGGSLNIQSIVITGNHSMGMPVTYDSAAPAQYMVGWNPGNSSKIRLWAVQNPLLNPTTVSVEVDVPLYSHPEDPPQQGSSVRPETFEARFWSACYRNGKLWATHHVNSGRVRQRWYEFDMGDWPNSGTPTLVQSGEIDLGSNIRTYFGSVWVDEDGTAAFTYARSSPDERISMERSYRTAADPPGTTRPSVNVRTSTSPSTSGRWGDYSAIVDDPLDAGVFWAVHEYKAAAGWRTRVARFAVEQCLGDVSSYCVSSPNSAGAGAVLESTGGTSIATADFGLRATGNPLGQSGIFFYGSGQQQTPFGEGLLCVSGPFFRLPVVAVDGTGVASFELDFTALPAGGEITPNSIWNFQWWYRDPAGGGSNFNTSDALSVEFCP